MNKVKIDTDLTKRDMAETLIRDEHTPWRTCKHFNWLMRKSKAELYDIFREYMDSCWAAEIGAW